MTDGWTLSVVFSSFFFLHLISVLVVEFKDEIPSDEVQFVIHVAEKTGDNVSSQQPSFPLVFLFHHKWKNQLTCVALPCLFVILGSGLDVSCRSMPPSREF